MPGIPLSVGSKLELLRAFVFANLPYTSPYTHTFVRVLCIYVYIILAVYNVHERGAEGFALLCLHWFIICQKICIVGLALVINLFQRGYSRKQHQKSTRRSSSVSDDDGPQEKKALTAEDSAPKEGSGLDYYVYTCIYIILCKHVHVLYYQQLLYYCSPCIIVYVLCINVHLDAMGAKASGDISLNIQETKYVYTVHVQCMVHMLCEVYVIFTFIIFFHASKLRASLGLKPLQVDEGDNEQKC